MPVSKKLTVVVADPEPTCRHGVVALCNSHMRFRVVGESRTVHETRTVCHKQRPNLLIIDPMLDGGEGIGLIQELLRWSKELRAVVFTRHRDAVSVQRALFAGACGYVTRLDEEVDLLRILLAVEDGKPHLSPMAAQGIATGLATGAVAVPGDALTRLSPREHQVFALLGLGRKTQEVATQLGVSIKTVESHMEHLKEKLNIRSGPALRKLAAEVEARC